MPTGFFWAFGKSLNTSPCARSPSLSGTTYASSGFTSAFCFISAIVFANSKISSMVMTPGPSSSLPPFLPPPRPPTLVFTMSPFLPILPILPILSFFSFLSASASASASAVAAPPPAAPPAAAAAAAAAALISPLSVSTVSVSVDAMISSTASFCFSDNKL